MMHSRRLFYHDALEFPGEEERQRSEGLPTSGTGGFYGGSAGGATVEREERPESLEEFRRNPDRAGYMKLVGKFPPGRYSSMVDSEGYLLLYELPIQRAEFGSTWGVGNDPQDPLAAEREARMGAERDPAAEYADRRRREDALEEDRERVALRHSIATDSRALGSSPDRDVRRAHALDRAERDRAGRRLADINRRNRTGGGWAA